jgi:hypothetical protein
MREGESLSTKGFSQVLVTAQCFYLVSEQKRKQGERARRRTMRRPSRVTPNITQTRREKETGRGEEQKEKGGEKFS